MRAGFDIQGLVFLVVVVASIIGQMMKAAKQHRDAAPRSPSAPRPDQPAGSGEPAQDMEEFLRNLMGGQAPRRAPPPMPAPVDEPAPEVSPSWNKPAPAYRSATTSPTVVPRSATTEPPRARHPKKREYRAVPAVAPPRVAPAPALVAAPAHLGAAQPNKVVAALKAEVHRQIKTPNALRSALLLREILGPPIALRGMNQIP